VIGCSHVHPLIQAGHYALADQILARIAPNLDKLGDDPAALMLWQASLASRALYAGKTREYLELSELAAESSRRAGDLRTCATQLHNLGHANLELGCYARAEQHLRAVAVDAERLGLANVEASAKNNLGFAVARQGRTAEGLELLEDAIRSLEVQADRRMLGGALNHQAQVLEIEFRRGARLQTRGGCSSHSHRCYARPGHLARVLTLGGSGKRLDGRAGRILAGRARFDGGQ
jgi:tetratricopeptide (TPR) repeat protein